MGSIVLVPIKEANRSMAASWCSKIEIAKKTDKENFMNWSPKEYISLVWREGHYLNRYLFWDKRQIVLQERLWNIRMILEWLWCSWSRISIEYKWISPCGIEVHKLLAFNFNKAKICPCQRKIYVTNNEMPVIICWE